MKKILLTSLLAVFAVSSANAAFEFNPYVGVRGGYDFETKTSSDSSNTPTDSTNGWMVGGVVGATFFDSEDFAARIEAEYIYTDLSDDSFDVSNHTALLNLVGDIKTGLAVTPYITAGIGYGWTTISLDNEYVHGDIDGDDLAWQLGVGLTYAATDAFDIDLGYRYINSGEMLSMDIESHQVYLGLRYAF